MPHVARYIKCVELLLKGYANRLEIADNDITIHSFKVVLGSWLCMSVLLFYYSLLQRFLFLSYILLFITFLLPYNLPWVEFFRRGGRQSQPCQCRCSAVSETQKSSSPLVSVLFLFSPARLFLPPLDTEKIIPEIVNRLNREK